MGKKAVVRVGLYRHGDGGGGGKAASGVGTRASAGSYVRLLLGGRRGW